MRKVFLLALAGWAVVGCRDAGGPDPAVAPPDAAMSEASLAGVEQFLVRADAADPVAAARLTAEAVSQSLTASSSSNSTECIGTLTGTFDRIVVPPGQTCILVDAVVEKNVDVLQDALLATFTTQVGHNVHGHDADVIQLNSGTQVNGNVEHLDGGNPVFFSYLQFDATVDGQVRVIRNFPDGHILIQLATVGKNLEVRDNGGSVFGQQVFDSQVGGIFDFWDNTAPGIRAVQFNTVDKKLRCRNNDSPMIGGPNFAAGGSEGQCF
jgi:hypothetical protein